MAGRKQHDYHIIEPSPWPFIGAMGAITMLIGIVAWINPDTDTPVVSYFAGAPWLFAIGLATVLYVAFCWWRDVIEEAHAGDHTPVVQIGLRYGMILFIMSEIMFFAAWFWMYFKHAIFPMQSEDFAPNGGVWPPEGVHLVSPWELPLLNTLILLTSGAACTWAHHALLGNDRKGFLQGLTLAIVLGAIFTAVQVYEYYEIIHLHWFVGNADDPTQGWIYGSSFFLATGFHGFHVLIGTIFLLVCLIRGLRGHFDAQNHVGFEAAAWYWHFVDVVWLFLFVGIYVGAVVGI
jgi:cytochrome c oxidase subunit 3